MGEWGGCECRFAAVLLCMKNKSTFSSSPFVLSLVLTMSCSSSEKKESDPKDSGFAMPYHLHAPEAVLQLPVLLREISGLAFSTDGKHLLAVNDEQGSVFYLNPQTGAIERTRDFGNTGDYEGIEAVGNDVYVVKSNGTIIRILESGEAETWPTSLDSDYDVEGLCYDSTQHRLLLACKGKAGKGSAFEGKKALYGFDLKTKTLADTPAFLLDKSELLRLKGGATGFLARLLEFFNADHAASAFGPSGLAVNPLDSNLYIVASVGKTLAVVHPDGRLLHAERLDTDMFPQPEGLCFDREGNLYIASEGKKGVGKVLRFDVKN